MADQPDNLKLTGPVTDEPASEINPIDDAIGKEARVVLKSVKVPDDNQLDDRLKKAIRETVKDHLKEYGVTFKDLARQVDYSESVISEVLRGIYNRADDTPILLKLNLWIDDDERRRRRDRPLGFYPTSVFKSIHGLSVFVKGNARMAGSRKRAAVESESARIAIGWGPGGCGKSLGAQALAAEDALSILIRLQTGSFNAAGVARLINDAAGWRGGSGGVSQVRFVIDKLRDSGRLLIVDEGHRLQFSGCEYLRDLADVCGIPILILATREFFDKVTRVRTASGSFNYAQFTRRVGFVCDLVKGLDGDGGSKRPIYSIDEIREIFRSDTVRITSDGCDYLQAIACTMTIGMLSEAHNIFDLAMRSAVRGSKVIDAAVLRKAAKRVLVPAGERDETILTQIEATLQANLSMRERERERAVAAG